MSRVPILVIYCSEGYQLFPDYAKLQCPPRLRWQFSNTGRGLYLVSINNGPNGVITGEIIVGGNRGKHALARSLARARARATGHTWRQRR